MQMENMNQTLDAKYSRISLQKFREKKITHHYLNDKYLKKLPRFANAYNLVVLYLHNNEIYEIRNLENCQNLINLYLQKNRILKMENLDNLRKLKKLYLGHNMISVVEDLQNLQQLEELHLEKQFLHEGNSLCFDPRSIYGVSHSLQVLNICHNNIQTIAVLAPLKFLRVLDASHNDLSDIDEICKVIKDWFYLKTLSFKFNPVCKDRLYREDIIANAYCLESLDQKEISDHTRHFLKRLHGERITHRLHKSKNLTEKLGDLPKKYSSAIQKAVSVSVLKENKYLNEDIFDERHAVPIPWSTLPKPQPVSKLRLLTKAIKKPQQKKKINGTFSDLKI